MSALREAAAALLAVIDAPPSPIVEPFYRASDALRAALAAEAEVAALRAERDALSRVRAEACAAAERLIAERDAP